MKPCSLPALQPGQQVLRETSMIQVRRQGSGRLSIQRSAVRASSRNHRDEIVVADTLAVQTLDLDMLFAEQGCKIGVRTGLVGRTNVFRLKHAVARQGRGRARESVGCAIELPVTPTIAAGGEGKNAFSKPSYADAHDDLFRTRPRSARAVFNRVAA